MKIKINSIELSCLTRTVNKFTLNSVNSALSVMHKLRSIWRWLPSLSAPWLARWSSTEEILRSNPFDNSFYCYQIQWIHRQRTVENSNGLFVSKWSRCLISFCATNHWTIHRLCRMAFLFAWNFAEIQFELHILFHSKMFFFSPTTWN